MSSGKKGATRWRKCKVLIVDDHPVVREGLAQRINRERDLVVCGVAETVRGALRAVARLQPDILVVDLSLPSGHGLELIKDLKNLAPDLRMLVFTMHDESIFAERALRAGARGYVMKQEDPEQLLAAIRAVLRGEYFVSERAKAAFLQSFFGQPADRLAQSMTRLTDRELEVYQFIGEGASTVEIARRLGRSVKTIESHRSNIKEKLAIKSAAELVCRANRWVQSRQ